jgi:hypothetical protein
MSAAQSLLTAEMIAMVQGGVSTIVSACDAALRPSIMRAVGSTIADDGRWVTVYLARRQSRQLLQDIAASGRVAVVFTHPASNRALQLKCAVARSRNPDTADRAILARYLLAMEKEIAEVGFPPLLTRTMLAHEFDDIVAVEFEPLEAFDQTPGPKAGAPVGPERAEGAA